MDRYNKVTNRNHREIVLLKSFPCVWGKCTFCDYIADNSTIENEINEVNFEVLKNITGEFGVLEVINSGSCFEIPKKSLDKIKDIIIDKNIKKLFLEAHFSYKNRLKEMKDFFGIEIVFKCGVESFDNNFRNEVLKKNANFKDFNEFKAHFDSPCIMVGIKGQTKDIIDKDMEIVLNHFNHATINVFVDNTSDVKRDEELVTWFIEKYKPIFDKNERFEVLYNNTDFGVGE
ncbi:MAG: radical SAM protein [Peptostreptococcaceae bacterium]